MELFLNINFLLILYHIRYSILTPYTTIIFIFKRYYNKKTIFEAMRPLKERISGLKYVGGVFIGFWFS